MILSKAPTKEQLRSVWKELCKMAKACPAPGGIDVPWPTNWWREDKDPSTWRWNGRDGRPNFYEEYQHLECYVESAQYLLRKLEKAEQIGR